MAKWVTKKNGNLQAFSKTKLIKGMRKSGCGVKDAEYVARKVSSKCYDKISTRKIGLMVVAHLRKRIQRQQSHSTESSAETGEACRLFSFIFYFLFFYTNQLLETLEKQCAQRSPCIMVFLLK